MGGDIGLHHCVIDILNSGTLCLVIFDGMWLCGSVAFASYLITRSVGLIKKGTR